MAIKKTYIYDENAETALSKLSEYLNKTAVPKYFSKVENTDGVISCYTDDNFVMMTIAYPLNSAGVTVYTKNGTSVDLKTGSSTYSKFNNAYECTNGISFQLSSTSSSSNHISAFTITKDEAGNTVIVSVNTLYLSSSHNSAISIYIINKNSGELRPIKTALYDSYNFVKTVLAPFVVAGNDGNYTPDVFLQLFSHNNETGTLDIEGAKYFSNGLWCIRDEQNE